MLRNFIVTALRNFWRNKFFSFINVFGLSIGLACCMLIFLFAKDELSFDRFHNNVERIYRVTAEMSNDRGELNPSGNTGLIQGPAFARHVPEISEFVRLQSDYGYVMNKGEVFDQEGLAADENFFNVFTFEFIDGDPRTALTGVDNVVLSEDVALKYFGTLDAVGKTLLVRTDSAFKPLMVSAVLKNSPQNSSIRIEMLRPIQHLISDPEETKNWTNFFLNTFVVLRPGADAAVVEKKCNETFTREAAPQLKKMNEQFGFSETYKYMLQPFTAMHLSDSFPANNGLRGGSDILLSYILGGIALFILVIACINFINLAVARSLKRAKEIGVRKVVGSRRIHLIAQFLGESFLMSFFAFALALLFVVLALPAFNSVIGKQLSFSYLLDLRLAAGYGLILLFTGLFAGFYPALVLTHFRPVDTLYGRMKFSGRNYFSRSLVVFQFVLAIFFIISTFVLQSQLAYLLNFPVGYDKSDVLQIRAANMTKFRLETVKQELLANPSVRKVTSEQNGTYITVAKINGDIPQEFEITKIDEQHFSFFKIPIIQGRNFNGDQSDTANSLIVNEAFVRAAGWKKPVGETIFFHHQKKTYNVIGVVKDFHTESLSQEVRPQVFTMTPEISYSLLYLKLDPKNKTAALAHAEKTIRRIFPDRPYSFEFLEDELANQYKNEKDLKNVVAFSSLLTIFISCIGLLGLAALSSEKRAREIGIRKVLGATVSAIVNQLTRDYMKLVLIASLIAIPLAWWSMHEFLKNYANHVPLKFPLFIIGSLLVALVAFVTTGLQSLKAASLNPVKNLRTE